jgi:hypothetical protein
MPKTFGSLRVSHVNISGMPIVETDEVELFVAIVVVAFMSGMRLGLISVAFVLAPLMMQVSLNHGRMYG